MKNLFLIFVWMAGMLLPLTVKAEDNKPLDSDNTENNSIAEMDQNQENRVDNVEIVSFTNEQQFLYNNAKNAYLEGKYVEAERLYQTINKLREFNITLYNLGKVYAKMNRCSEAYDTYHRAENASVLDSDLVMPEEMTERIRKAIEELDEQCCAKIVFNCVYPDEIFLSIDNGDHFKCDKNPIPVVPGKHSYTARSASGFTTGTVDAVAGQITETRVEIYDYIDTGYPVECDCDNNPEYLEYHSRNYKIAGYSLLGAGVVGAGISGGLMGYYKHHNQDSHKDDLVYTYTFLALGSAMAVTGAVLLIVNEIKYQSKLDELERKYRDISFSPVISPSFSGISLRGWF